MGRRVAAIIVCLVFLVGGSMYVGLDCLIIDSIFDIAHHIDNSTITATFTTGKVLEIINNIQIKEFEEDPTHITLVGSVFISNLEEFK